MTFEHYVQQRLPQLLRIAQSICGERQLGEDLVQDVLIKVHARWAGVQASDHPDAYVRRMLVNEYLSWRRKWARLIPHAEVGIRLVDERSDYAAVHSERDALQREIAALPARQRIVVTLRYLADLPDDQIAQVLGCKPATVRVHASRALAALRVSSLAAEQRFSPTPIGARDDSHRG